MRWSKRRALPSIQIPSKVRWPIGAPNHDAIGQISCPAPGGNLGDTPVRDFFHEGIPRAIDTAASHRNISGHGDQEEKIGITFGRYRSVGGARLADIKRGGVGNRGRGGKYLREVIVPVLGEEQAVVEQLGDVALDSEIHQHGTGTRQLFIPPGLGVGLEFFGKKLSFAVVQVSGRDHQVCAEKMHGSRRIDIFNAVCASFCSAAALGANALDA